MKQFLYKKFVVAVFLCLKKLKSSLRSLHSRLWQSFKSPPPLEGWVGDTILQHKLLLLLNPLPSLSQMGRNLRRDCHTEQCLLAMIAFFILSISSSFAAEAVKKPNADDKPPLILRGADMKGVSRLVFDGIPQNRFKVVPLNNQLNIIFEDFEYSFLKQDLLSLRLLKNIKKLKVIQKDNFTILNIAYKCDCQADFYKWHNQKMVLDVFGLDAVANPLRIPKKETQTAKITEPSSKDSKQAQKQDKQLKQEHKDKITHNFENYLKNLINTANEKGLVQFKDPLKSDFQQPNDDPVADIIANSQNKDTAPKDTAKKDTVQKDTETEEIPKNIHISNKNVLSYDETEKLLPTDNNLFDSKNKQNCLPDSAFMLPANDPEYDTFYDKISDYRYDLIGEFDAVNSEKALKLVHHYISYGMGEEALQVLSNFPTPEHRGKIAKSMAELLTNRTLSKDSIFNHADKCAGVQSLWTAYRYFKLGNEEKAAQIANTSDIKHFLKKLPLTLQLQIGSSLALNLVRQNSYKVATQIVDKLATQTGQFSSDVLLVRGLIDAKNGLADRALMALENVVNNTHGVDQQMAGLALAELKLASNISLNEQDISILEEIVFLKSRELIGVQGLALIAENESRYGNFNTAFKRLSQKIYDNKQVKDPALIKSEQLFKRIAISGEGLENPDTFNVYWDYPKLIPPKPVFLKAFADKLYDYGHDAATIDVINDIQKNFVGYTQKNDVTLLKAQAFFRQGKYKNVIKTMDTPFKDKNYLTLKAEAFHKLNKNLRAIKTLKSFDDKQSTLAKARYALAAQEWETASQDYTQAKKLMSDKDNELYYRSKATAYMSGFQYPGSANEYKKPEDVIFHQPNKQAKGVDNIVLETQKLIDVIENRSGKINQLIDKKT